MKKQLVLLFSIVFLSFFLVINVSAQEKKKVVEKAKIEVPSKCKGCPSLKKCTGDTTTPVKAVIKNKKKVSDKKKKK